MSILMLWPAPSGVMGRVAISYVAGNHLPVLIQPFIQDQLVALVISMADFRVLIPAAGRGTRAGLPYPKTLYPVDGHPSS